MMNMKLKRSHWRNSWNTPAVISKHVPRLYILVPVIHVTWYGGWKRTHNDVTALYHARLNSDPTIHPICIKERKRRKNKTHMFKTAAVAAVVPNNRKRGLNPSDERALIMQRCCWTHSVCLLMKYH